MYLNGTLVTQSSNNHPYRAYIENLLSFSKEAKDTQPSSMLWYRNTAEFFDVRGATNLGYTKRKALAAQSRKIDMFGRKHLDLLSQNRYLLNGMEIRMRLIRSKDVFCLLGNANHATNKVSLKEVSLFVRKIKANPSVQLAHTKALQHGTAKYPLRRVQQKTLTVPRGNMTITKENLFLGQQPTRILLAAIENEAFNGGIITKSLFNFKHSNINFVAIYCDGVQIPAKPPKPHFENDRFIRSYTRLFTQIGEYHRDTGNGISREQYNNGCAIFAFDLTSQMNSTDDCFELIKSGNIRVEIHFAAAVAATRTICIRRI